MKRIDVVLGKIQMRVWFKAEKERMGGLLGEKEEMEETKAQNALEVLMSLVPTKWTNWLAK
jgi:hypothetical protein